MQIDIDTIDFQELRAKFDKFIVLMDGWVRNIFWTSIEEGHHNHNFKAKQTRTYEECKNLTMWD